jgi:hypothetical protein
MANLFALVALAVVCFLMGKYMVHMFSNTALLTVCIASQSFALILVSHLHNMPVSGFMIFYWAASILLSYFAMYLGKTQQ